MAKVVGQYGTCARVYVNTEVSVKIFCRRRQNGMTGRAPSTCRMEEASIDVNERLSSPHQVILSHLFNVCQPASMKVLIPNTSPCLHCSCRNNPSTRNEGGRNSLSRSLLFVSDPAVLESQRQNVPERHRVTF